MSSPESLPPKLSGDDPGPDSPLPGIMYRLTRRRRLVLELLLDARSPIRERELARRVAAWESGSPPSEIDGDAVDAVHVAVRQVDLPALEDVDLVDRTGGGSVTTTDHVAYDEHWFQRLVRADAELDALVECLASERRLAVLDALGDGPLTRDELAERIAADDPACSATDVGVSLRHGHLPKLEETGLIDRVAAGDDADAPTYRLACSSLEEAWLEFLSAT